MTMAYAFTTVIALDVDSTVMTHGYPGLGEDLGAIPWLKKALELDPQHIKFILCTMRAGESAQVAKEWLEEQGIPIWSVNCHPEQHVWTDSPKPHYHILCDDRAVGTPLDDDGNIEWDEYGPMLLDAVRRVVGF